MIYYNILHNFYTKISGEFFRKSKAIFPEIFQKNSPEIFELTTLAATDGESTWRNERYATRYATLITFCKPGSLTMLSGLAHSAIHDATTFVMLKYFWLIIGIKTALRQNESILDCRILELLFADEVLAEFSAGTDCE